MVLRLRKTKTILFNPLKLGSISDHKPFIQLLNESFQYGHLLRRKLYRQHNVGSKSFYHNRCSTIPMLYLCCDLRNTRLCYLFVIGDDVTKCIGHFVSFVCLVTNLICPNHDLISTPRQVGNVLIV